ncbi:MAG: hypothetical protein R6U08_10180 [Bacillota bacterium]
MAYVGFENKRTTLNTAVRQNITVSSVRGKEGARLKAAPELVLMKTAITLYLYFGKVIVLKTTTRSKTAVERVNSRLIFPLALSGILSGALKKCGFAVL